MAFSLLTVTTKMINIMCLCLYIPELIRKGAVVHGFLEGRGLVWIDFYRCQFLVFMTQKKKVWATGSCSASPLGLIGERDYSPLG